MFLQFMKTMHSPDLVVQTLESVCVRRSANNESDYGLRQALGTLRHRDFSVKEMVCDAIPADCKWPCERIETKTGN